MTIRIICQICSRATDVHLGTLVCDDRVACIEHLATVFETPRRDGFRVTPPTATDDVIARALRIYATFTEVSGG
jgi:hypothetical protein